MDTYSSNGHFDCVIYIRCQREKKVAETKTAITINSLISPPKVAAAYGGELSSMEI
jgi:hypothetical protein